jgi:hypothetical protein
LARIVIIRHAEERPGDFHRFMLHAVGELWKEAGHKVLVHYGCDDLPDADLAILHVNHSVVPQEYVDAVKRYPRSLNGDAVDIRKRTVSRNLLSRGDDWDGPVIVKTDLNYSGFPEWRAAKWAYDRGEGGPVGPPPRPYRLFQSVREVPERVWDKPAMVVERFLPEFDGEHYYLRVYLFLGDRGRSRRSRSLKRIIKGHNIIDVDQTPLEIPEFIVAERERLGFDFGKFDYVIHDGEPILLDANRTPGHRAGSHRPYVADLAGGLPSVLGEAAAAN